MTDQRDKTSNGTQNPIPRTATAGELLAVKNVKTIFKRAMKTTFTWTNPQNRIPHNIKFQRN